ncbi:MAG: DUF1512 domain-containing protein [Euryarchaeota archaeon]|nr:DUF1512 domain-containing protein [Euryarchaeota archaeon]
MPEIQLWQGFQVLFTLLFFALILIYPRYLFYRMVADMEEVAETLENYAGEAADIVTRICMEKGSLRTGIKDRVKEALEFFLIPPVDLDPYGILRKLEHLFDKAEDRLNALACELSPGCSPVWRANIVALLKGGIGINTLAKVVRHYVELVKKTNNLQLAMLFQMNLPIIRKIADAHMAGIRAISRGEPIGDSVGPLVAARLMRGQVREIARDVVYSEETIAGRRVFVVKARGPGANLGKLGDAVKRLAEAHEVSKIITVDASLKMEGEPTGKVSQGVGAAIGDPGPEKAKIEEAAVARNIPLEAIAIKMSIEEAISPMPEEVYRAVPEAIRRVEESVAALPEGSAAILVGVGNTCGIGNSRAEVEEVKYTRREKEEEELPALDRLVKRLVERQKRAEKRAREREAEMKRRARRKARRSGAKAGR